MTKRWTHTAAFAHFGTEPRNVQWSWSARSDSAVVVTLWQDYFVKGENGKLTYSRSPVAGDEPDTRPGFRELMDNLAFSQDHCDGLFHVIVAKAKDKTAHPRSIESCHPSEMVMRLTELDIAQGSYRAEQKLPGDV